MIVGGQRALHITLFTLLTKVYKYDTISLDLGAGPSRHRGEMMEIKVQTGSEWHSSYGAYGQVKLYQTQTGRMAC